MFLKKIAGWIALISLTAISSVNCFAAAEVIANDPFSKPTQPISSINAIQATNINATVHVQGAVIDVRPGEYIVISDETGIIFADTQQAVTPKLKDMADVVGTPCWDGSRFRLRNASFHVATNPEVSAPKEVSAASDRPAELPVLTKAWQVRDLSPEKAAWKYPVKLRAVVTYFVKNKRLCVQDDISGIYVNANGKASDLKIGDLVEIEGATDPGGYAPIVMASNVVVVGTAPLPEPRQVTVYQLVTSQEGSQWIEAQGVVQSITYSNGEARLVLNDPTGRLPVIVPASNEPTQLLDAIIRVRGISASSSNSRRQFAGPSLMSPSMDFVQIEEPGVVDPLSLPVRPIVSLSQFRPRLTLERRINVAGTVTLCQPGQWFFLQDTNDGVQVFTSQTDGIAPGTRVKAAGYPAMGSYGSILRDAVCRIDGPGDVPKPELLTESKPLNPQLHGRWTQIDAQLLDRNKVGKTEILKVQFGSRIVEASCLDSSVIAKQIQAGSQVRLTGVYSVLADETRTAVSFQLLLPAAQYIQVLQQPSWWKSQHAVPVVGIMTGYKMMTSLMVALTVIGTGILLWAAMLRRRVHQQTANLREQMAQQAALEQRFRDIFEGANDVIFTHDLEGHLTSLNTEGQRVLGYNAEEAKQLVIDHIVPPDNRNLTRQLLEQKSGDGSVTNCECALVAKDGQQIPVEISARVMLKDGKPQGIQAIARNNAERKQIEIALRDSEARYRRLVELSPIAMYVQCEGQIAFINAAALQLLGALRPEEILGKAVLDFIHPDYHGMESQRVATMRDTGVPVPLTDQKYLRLDGGEVDVEATAAPFLFGNKPAAQVILHDIGERKRTEEDLFNSQQTLRTILDTIPQRVFWKDRNSVFLGCNKAYAQDCGYDNPGDMVGKTDFETASAAMAESYRADDRQVMETREPKLNYEEPRVGQDDSQRWLRSTKVPLFDKDGQVVGMLGTYEDITDRKQSEAALAEASNLLETMLVNTPDYIYFKDRESRFVRYSHKFLKLLKLTDPNSLKGKSDFDLFTEEHARPAYDDEQRIIQTGEPLIGKLERETHVDGHISWALTTKMPWRDKDGNIIGTFGISKDVTEMKETEDRFSETSSLLETLLANSPDCIYFKDAESRFVRYSKSFAALFNIANAEDLKGKSDFDFFTEEHARPAFEDEQEIIRTGKPIVGKLEKETHPDGHITWALTTKMPWSDRDGNTIGTFGISKDVTSIKETEDKLAYEQELFQVLAGSMPDSIYFKDLESRFVRLSRYKVERSRMVLVKRFQEEYPDQPLPDRLATTDKCGKYLLGKTDFDVYGEDRARKAFDEEQEIIHTGNPVVNRVEQGVRADDGKEAWFLTTKLPWRDKQGKIIGTFGVTRDISALKEAETKLEHAHQRLIETSRLAGMAEVATDVLHNVGNVLNSVNVSCSLTIDRVKTSKMASLGKVSALLSDNRGRLGEFFGSDPRGQQIPDYIAALAEHLTGEQKLLLKELEQLLKHIDHIKQIVAMQQSYAKVAGVLESISPTQLVEDALHINAAALTRHDVDVCREIDETPPILTEKHKVLQILVNLIRNAKYALDDAKRTDKLMTLKVHNIEDGMVKIQVIDNGVGIPAENLTRIFSHGFTTRRNGHGFGLHSSALAIKELGGSLLAHSDGPGKGAVFTLILPKAPPEKSEKAS